MDVFCVMQNWFVEPYRRLKKCRTFHRRYFVDLKAFGAPNLLSVVVEYREMWFVFKSVLLCPFVLPKFNFFAPFLWSLSGIYFSSGSFVGLSFLRWFRYWIAVFFKYISLVDINSFLLRSFYVYLRTVFEGIQGIYFYFLVAPIWLGQNCNTIQYNTIQYNTIQYNTIQ